MLAARLLGVGAFVFLGPGLACLAWMPDALEWPEHLVYGFTISYLWIFALSILLPVMGWTVDHAALLTAGVVAVIVPWRRLRHLRVRPFRSPGLSLIGVLLAMAVVVYAVAAWWIEPPMHGDAALDLISVSRFADGGPIHFDNTSIIPTTRATYIFQPYQLALGLIARWSAVETIVAFEKIRPLLVLLSLTSVFVLLTQLATMRRHAYWAFCVVLMFVGLDMATWQDKSLFPVVHRGGIAGGICAPVLMILILAALRRHEPGRELRRRLSLWLASPFLVAFMCTHALEVYTQLFFAVAVGVTVFIGADPDRERGRVWKLALSLAVALAIYLPLHARAVPELTAFEDELKDRTRAEFVRDHPTLGAKLAGTMSQESDDLLAHRLPATTTAIIGVPALAAAMFVAPAAATMIALTVVALALLFVSPAGFLLLALATSADSVQETTAFFALLGLLGVSLGIAAIASAALTWGDRVRGPLSRSGLWMAAVAALVVAWPTTARALTAGTLMFVRSDPRPAVGFAFLLLILIVAYTMLQSRQAGVRPRPLLAGAVFSVLLAYPLVGLGLPNIERVTLVAAVKGAGTSTSVLDGSRYYDVVATTILPPLPVPSSIVDDLRRVLPSRQVLVANPHYSCSLAALVDAYCVNPEHIYGQYFLGARRYQLEYVYSIDGAHIDWHPFFNDTWPIEDRERRFLKDYGVTYLLADPSHAVLIARKLDALQVAAARAYSREGYVLYRFESHP